MGIVCEIFPNRVVSEKIYHVLLEIHGEERSAGGFGYGMKVDCKKLIFNNGFKDQLHLKASADKLGMATAQKYKKLSPSSILDAFKTL